MSLVYLLEQIRKIDLFSEYFIFFRTMLLADVYFYPCCVPWLSSHNQLTLLLLSAYCATTRVLVTMNDEKQVVASCLCSYLVTNDQSGDTSYKSPQLLDEQLTLIVALQIVSLVSL